MPPSDVFHSWEYERAGKRKGGRVYIDVRSTGEVTFHEGYITRNEARRAERGEANCGAKPQRPELTSTLQTYVDLHRHAAVRAALLEHSGIALRMMVAHAIVGSHLWTVRPEPQTTRNEDVRESIETCRAETVFDTHRRAVLNRLGFSSEEPTVTGGNGDDYGVVGVFLRLIDLCDEDLARIIAVLIGETMAAGSAAVEVVGSTLGLDMADWWQADDALFSLLRDREVLSRIVGDVAGETVASANAKEKSKTLKRIWAPPSGGMQRQSRWFYERARGQYHDALAENRTEAERRKWELIHPRNQLVTKTDLAKYEHSWSQLPHIVSRGGQKCYLDFMDALDQRGAFDPDERYFERCVARAILFRQSERIVSRQKFGGYRANIVTYLLAWLSHHTAKRVDLDAIWSAQELSGPLAAFIEVLSIHAHAHVTTPPGGQNVTEWCKKEACWERFRDTFIEMPPDVEAGLLSRDKARTGRSTSVLEEQASEAEAEQVERVSAISSQTWFDLAAWAKDTQSLQAWQRSLAFSLGRLAGNGKKPSRKQAMHGEKIIAEARTLGFRG